MSKNYLVQKNIVMLNECKKLHVRLTNNIITIWFRLLINCVTVGCIKRLVNYSYDIKLLKMDTTKTLKTSSWIPTSYQTWSEETKSPSVFKCVFVCEFLIVPGLYHSRLTQNERERQNMTVWGHWTLCGLCPGSTHLLYEICSLFVCWETLFALEYSVWGWAVSDGHVQTLKHTRCKLHHAVSQWKQSYCVFSGHFIWM